MVALVLVCLHFLNVCLQFFTLSFFFSLGLFTFKTSFKFLQFNLSLFSFLILIPIHRQLLAQLKVHSHLSACLAFLQLVKCLLCPTSHSYVLTTKLVITKSYHITVLFKTSSFFIFLTNLFSLTLSQSSVRNINRF